MQSWGTLDSQLNYLISRVARLCSQLHLLPDLKATTRLKFTLGKFSDRSDVYCFGVASVFGFLIMTMYFAVLKVMLETYSGQLVFDPKRGDPKLVTINDSFSVSVLLCNVMIMTFVCGLIIYKMN